MTIADELIRLNPSAKVELFVIDATAIGGTVLRFVAQTNPLSQPVVWQGNTYTPLGIQAEGFEFRPDGSAPRPTLSVSNIGGLTGAYARQYGKLLGAMVTRKATRAKYLDAVNFAGGNPNASPTTAEPDSIWFVDRLAKRNSTVISWELVSPFDMQDLMVPARDIRTTVCGVRYRSTECGYTGGPVAKVDDTATSDPALDRCSLHVSGCKLRFGATGELPIFIFPGAGTTRQV